MIQYSLPPDSDDLSLYYYHGPYTEMHTHAFWEIFLVTDGVCLHKINGQMRQLKKNTLCLIRPNDMHSIQAVAALKSSHINIRIRDSYLRKWLNLFDESMYDKLLTTDLIEIELTSNISQYTLEIVYKLQTLDLTDVLYRYMLKLTFLDLFRIVLYNMITKTYMMDKQYIKPVQTIIELMSKPENIALSIEDICKLSNYSHSYLVKMFNKHLNMTPKAYFMKLKMNYARTQLEYTMLPISYISSMIGITNVCYFNTDFKKEFNITPGKYRKKWHLYYNL